MTNPFLTRSTINSEAADAKTRIKIIDSVVKLVLTRHVNVSGIDYDMWRASVAEKTDELLKADVVDFEEGVRELLKQLGTSHTAFYHSQPRELVAQHTVNATLRSVSDDHGDHWMFLDVFEGGPAHIAGIRPGDILCTVDGQQSLPPRMPQFGIARTHVLEVSKQNGPARAITVRIPNRKGTKQRPPIVEPKSPICSVAAEGTGLLRIPYFSGAFGMRFGSAVDRAIEELVNHGCVRLIMDLRGCIGGSLGLARVASYMCSGRLPIGHSLTPWRLRKGYTADELPCVPMPRTRPELLWTLARFAFRDKSVMLLTQGLGDQPFHGRVIVLVNEWTNSAAEMVAAFAAENGLATLVGRRTRGNVLGAMNFKVPGGYWVRLPIFGWYTSQGRTLEKTGVEPDVVVDVDPSALAAGHDVEMRRAIEVVCSL